MVLSFWGFYRQSIKNRQILFGLYQFKKKRRYLLVCLQATKLYCVSCSCKSLLTRQIWKINAKAAIGKERGTNLVIKFNSHVKCPFLVLMTLSVCNCSALCTHIWLVGVSKCPCRYVQTKKDKWIKFGIIFVTRVKIDFLKKILIFIVLLFAPDLKNEFVKTLPSPFCAAVLITLLLTRHHTELWNLNKGFKRLSLFQPIGF